MGESAFDGADRGAGDAVHEGGGTERGVPLFGDQLGFDGGLIESAEERTEISKIKRENASFYL